MAMYRRGRVWWIHFYWKGQHYQRATSARTKTEARHEFEQWKYEVKSGRAAQESKLLFRELGEKYLAEYAVTKRSYGRDVVLVRNLGEFFGDYRVGDITPHLIMRYRTRRSRRVTPSTTNRELSCLRKMLNLAVDWNLLAVNPTTRVKPLLLVEDNLRERILTDEEQSRFIECCSPPYLQDMVILALNTGMRVGEILSLKWKNVVVHFNQIIIEANNSKSKRLRRVPMNAISRAILERLQGSSQGEYVFDREGGPFHYQTVMKSFKLSCRRAGLSGLRFHDLRHNFATKLSSLNVPLTTVQKLLGHSTITVTQRYAHGQYEQEAVDLLVVGKNGSQVATISAAVRDGQTGMMAASA